MKSSKKKSIKKMKKINVLIFILFTLIIPTILNSPLFSNILNNNFEKEENRDITDNALLTPKLNSPIDAHNFNHFKTITIDHNQVSGTSGLTNFPFLISIFDEDLRFDVQSDGDDIGFSSNNLWLDHEIEVFDQTYNGTHAKLVVWVRISALSATIDTIIRMYYGNSTMSSRQNPEGVWDSNYYAVYHMNQDPSSSFIMDSTVNDYDLTAGPGFISGDLVDGVIGKAIQFGGVNTEYLELTSGFSNPTNALSLEMWFRPQLFDTYQRYLTARWSYPDLRFRTNNQITTRIRNNLGNVSSTEGPFNGWMDQFYHFAMTWQGDSVGIQKHYINGSLDRQDYDAEALGTSSSWSGFNIGSDTDHSDPIGGLIEEFRITSNVRSLDWFQTEYNNQYNPNSFYTVDAEQNVVWEPPNSQFFAYYKLITIDQNEVSGSGIHYNFPFLFSFIDGDLKYKVQSDGDDIAFATDGDWLDHEILVFDQDYSSTEAELKVWVQIPYLYSSKNTTIAMYYGNSTMSSRENAEGVWDSGYEAVYHLDDDFLDSTTHNRDGTNTGSVDITGKIGDGQDFERDRATDNIDIGTWSVAGTQITIQTWINLESFDIGDARILSKNSGTSNAGEAHVWMLGTDTFPNRLRGRIKTGTSDSSGTSTVVATSGDLSLGTWYLTALIYDGSNIRFVLDGNPVGSFSKSGSLRVNNWPIVIGNSPSGARNLDGIVDEVKISSTVRSNDWLKTEYDNQNDPSSFGSVGTEEIVNDITPNADYFDYHKIITIDHTNVNGTGSHVNFPFLVSLIDADLSFDVQSDGDDIAFSIEGQWLDHQIELFDKSFNGTHAKLVAWVRIPFLSTVEDTEITMHYGNSTMNSRQNPTGVWSDYKAVWHFNEPSGTGDYIKDSTIGNYDGTPFGTQFNGSGQIDGSRSFSSTGDNRIVINQGTDFFDGDNSFTFSFWIYPNYQSDAEWESLTEGQVFYKSSSIGLSRLWRQSFFGPGEGRFQPDIRFATYGSTYLNIVLYRQEWTYVTYSYDGNDLRAYRNDQLAQSENIGGFSLLADPSSFYFGRSSNSLKGNLDEFRILDTYRSDGWVATEYYNQFSPTTFFNISSEQHSKPIVEADALIKAVDLYGNFLPNVTISMYQYTALIEADITNADGTVNFTDIIAGEYNFTASIYSDIAGVTEYVNITSEAISLNQSFQIIDIICDVTSHYFEVIDIDGSPLESGWIMVGNDTHILKRCNIDSTGRTSFWWVDGPPSQYNYTVYYSNALYNPSILTLSSGDITTENDTINIQVGLTTVGISVKTINSPITPVSGAKLKFTLDDPLGVSIVNLTTDIDGQITLRWLNSSGIGGDYCVQIEFFGLNRLFNESFGGPAAVLNFSFTVVNKESREFRILIDLNKFQTELISLNPTDYIEIEWGAVIKLRTLFNVSKVESGYESLLGPTYADLMTYEMLLGGEIVQSGIFLEEDGTIGRYSLNIDTKQVNSDEKYIIIISAYKSGFTIPSDLILQLEVLNNNLELNQSANNNSAVTSYWLESANMTLNSYGVSSETLTIENALFQTVDHDFSFLISDIHNKWNLSKIIFNVYGISWNAGINDINLTIEDADGAFSYTFDNNTSGWDYTQGTWTGITLDLNRASQTNDNNFGFKISGTFSGTVDIVVDAYCIRDSLSTQYSKFNVSNEISLLSGIEGWAIKNIIFEISDCYYTSNWSTVDLSSLSNLNITTNEGFIYSLDSGYSNGTGILTIEDRVIYPLVNQYLFTIDSESDIIFNTIIKVEYIQEFYVNQIFETYNVSKSTQGIINGGIFQLNVNEDSWDENEANLWVSGIKSGLTYLNPSDVSMNITIGGQTYDIMDHSQGIGKFSLTGFTKNQIFQAQIDTTSPVNFSLLISIEYQRELSYEVIGSLTYYIMEEPLIFGTVPYDLQLEYYLKTIDTSQLDADEYTIRFSIMKDNYISMIKDLNLHVLNRPTLLNGSSEFFRKIENIYVKDVINFSLVYTDVLTGSSITNLRTQYYIWESYDQYGDVIDSDQGDIISTLDNRYILDFDTETRSVGEYLLVITIDKDNYDRKNGMILLTVNKRILNYSLGHNFKDYKSSVAKGNSVRINVTLTDPTQGGILLNNATVKLTIGGNTYELERYSVNISGVYTFDLSTSNINTFFSSQTLTGIINITGEDYISQEFTIIIVVEMETIFFGIPTFYFIVVVSAIVALVGSIVGYRVYQNAKIPTFVKRVREMKKAINKGKTISESNLYHNKNGFIAERLNHKWQKLGLSLGQIIDTGGYKIKKTSKIERRIIDTVKEHELKPTGLIVMKWDERIGTEILAKYPEETILSEKTLMQIYSTHEYSGDKGIITLSAGTLNIISYYSGPETSYYLLLVLNLDDDPDLYEGGMADTFRIILENIEDDSYKQLLPSLFRRLSLFPSLSDEEVLSTSYQDEIKRMIIDNLRDICVITKSELTVWLKDKFIEGFIDLDATLSEMLKKEFIKQVSVKGLTSELIVLINDIFMLRAPPVNLYEDPTNRGLPLQFTKEYLADVKQFFQDYRPSKEDNLQIMKIFQNPDVYHILRLLRTTIASRQDLEKLRKKGVRDIYEPLKLLFDAGMIKIFRDDNNNEYYALRSDFYIDLVFPKYLLRIVKTMYEQKSIANRALIEYLQILEDTYYNLKSKKK
ncbi:MAG: DUF2341 domain-containing protein [Promethearchaeota archaeon]|jgi:hypothetical protein